MKTFEEQWESTNVTLLIVDKLISDMHNRKPRATVKRDSPEEVQWEVEMTEIRGWIVLVHQHRIKINQRWMKEKIAKT